MNCLLCGIKHCGKTTLGKLLAQKRNALFVDSDELIETRYFLASGSRKSCRELFSLYGEAAFRKMEADALKELFGNSDEFDREKVIALGGGAVENPCLGADFWKTLGVLVQIEVAPEVAYARMEQEKELPPFLRDAVDTKQRFMEICQTREASFRRCAELHFQPDPALSADQNCEALAALLNRKD